MSGIDQPRQQQLPPGNPGRKRKLIVRISKLHKIRLTNAHVAYGNMNAFTINDHVMHLSTMLQAGNILSNLPPYFEDL